MFQLGLTGGIGSGKTLVCSVLEKFGVPVYYADSEARRLMNSNEELRRNIGDLFGGEVYNGHSLNRKVLAEKVFGDEVMVEKLNRLVHPAVRKDYTEWVESKQNAPYVVEEAAILFESGASVFMDMTVLIYAPEMLRIRRVMQRDAVDEEHVRRRMKHQMDEEEKKKRADHIIYNDEKEMLLPQVVALHNSILKKR